MNDAVAVVSTGDIEALSAALTLFLEDRVEDGRHELRQVSSKGLARTYTAGIRL